MTYFLRGACTIAGRYQYLSSDHAKTSSFYVKTHFEFFIPELFWKFGIVFEKIIFLFFKVIFKLSYQTNILINFLVSSMYTKRNHWGIKSIEYIFLFLFQHTRKCIIHFFFVFYLFFVYFLCKKSPNENSKIYSIEVLA